MIDTVQLMMIGEDGVDFKFINSENTYDPSGNIKMKKACCSYGNTKVYVKFESYSKRLFLSFSIPQLLYGDNVCNVSEKDLEFVIPKLEDALNGTLVVDYKLFELCRVDISYTLQMSRPAKEYIDLLSLGNYNGYLKEWKREEQTITKKSKRRSITFYDKYEQMKKKKYFDINLINPNYLRIELSLRKAEAIRDYFKLKRNLRFTELLTPTFLQKTKRLLLIVFDKEISSSFSLFQGIDNDKEIVNSLICNGTKRNLMQTFALEKCKLQNNGVEYLKGLFKGYLDPSSISKNLKNRHKIKNGKSGSAKLLNEIREKIVAIE